jgi:hypothetical protein
MVFVLHTQWLEPLSVAWVATSMPARAVRYQDTDTAGAGRPNERMLSSLL